MFKITTPLLICLLLNQAACANSQPSNTEMPMLKMNNANEAQYWRSVNDNVMGGISQGDIQFEQDYALFSGKISLENNGGFSSVRRSIPELSAQLEQITVDIEGDGKMYQLRAEMWLNGYRISYKHEFQTQLGKRLKLQLPIADFTATYRGRKIWDAPKLKPELIRQLGFLVTSKKAEPFQLKIHEVSFQ